MSSTSHQRRFGRTRLRWSVSALSLNRADREESRRITRFSSGQTNPGIAASSRSRRAPSNGVRSWETSDEGCATSLPVWLIGRVRARVRGVAPGQARMASKQAAARVPTAPPQTAQRRGRRPSRSGSELGLPANLRKHRVVELGQHPFEFRVVACFFPEGRTRLPDHPHSGRPGSAGP